MCLKSNNNNNYTNIAFRKLDRFKFGPTQYYRIEQGHICRQFGHSTIGKITLDKWQHWRLSRRSIPGVAKIENVRFAQ